MSVLEPGHLGAASPSGKFLLKQGPGRAGAPPAGEYSPHTPISAPPPAPQQPGARPAPLPGALILRSAVGQGRSSPRPDVGGRRPGVAEPGSHGANARLSARVREEWRAATGRGWPGDCGSAGGRGCYQHVCVRVWGWGAGCVREGSPEVRARGVRPGQDAWVGGSPGWEESGRGSGAGHRSAPPNPGSGRRDWVRTGGRCAFPFWERLGTSWLPPSRGWVCGGGGRVGASQPWAGVQSWERRFLAEASCLPSHDSSTCSRSQYCSC